MADKTLTVLGGYKAGSFLGAKQYAEFSYIPVKGTFGKYSVDAKSFSARSLYKAEIIKSNKLLFGFGVRYVVGKATDNNPAITNLLPTRIVSLNYTNILVGYEHDINNIMSLRVDYQYNHGSNKYIDSYKNIMASFMLRF